MLLSIRPRHTAEVQKIQTEISLLSLRQQCLQNELAALNNTHMNQMNFFSNISSIDSNSDIIDINSGTKRPAQEVKKDISQSLSTINKRRGSNSTPSS